jgi:dephospho-CoA kinase
MKQNNCKIIGLTGGIATGKSTVSNIIRKKGYKVIDADEIAKDVVEKDKPAYKEIVKIFGDTILNEDKSINRKKLGSIVFKEDIIRKKLNDIVHPYVFKTIQELILKYIYNEKYIFVDIPLLFEEIDKFNKYGIHFHEIWLVYADEKTQLYRLMKRDFINKKEGLERIKAQLPMEIKREYATKIIDNRGDLKTLEKQTEKIIDEIM